MKLKAIINGQSSTIDIELNQIIKYATVTGLENNKIKLKFDGEQEQSQLSYFASTQCEIGNRVVCINDGFNIIVIGVIK